MDETTQETLPVEMETQAVETVPADMETQVSEAVTTDPLQSDEVPATTQATVPSTVSNYYPYEIYGVDYSTESTTEPVSETIPMTTEPTYIEVIETVGADIVHSSLFGAFLICGTQVGLALLRKIYGS